MHRVPPVTLPVVVPPRIRAKVTCAPSSRLLKPRRLAPGLFTLSTRRARP
jgi:hypothetical protein